MKSFLIKLSLVALLFFIADKAAYFVLKYSAERQQDQRLKYILNGEMNKELIILGSSRGAMDVDAEYLGDLTGKDTYNLSYKGSDVLFANYILKTLLKHNKKPERIIYIVDNPMMFTKSLKFSNQKLYNMAYNSDINDTLVARGENPYLSKFLWSQRIRPSFLRLKDEFVNPDDKVLSAGSILVTKTRMEVDWEGKMALKMDYYEKDDLPEKHAAMVEIKKRCAKEGIELVFAFPPNYFRFNEEFYFKFKDKYAVENRMMHYNLESDRYANKYLFYDVSHLNANGAKLFTEELAYFVNRR